MSLATLSNTAARRSSGALSSCPGGVRDSPGRPLDTARRAGRAACVPRIAVDPAGWCAGLTVLMLKRSGIGFPLDALSWTRISLSEEQRPLKEHHQDAAREKPARNESQRKEHRMQHPRPIMQKRRTRQTLPATSAIAHRTLSTPHARATSCSWLTG